MEDAEFLDLLKTLSSLITSPNWSIRHGSMLTLSSTAMYSPSMICQSPLFPSLVDGLKSALRDDKVLFELPNKYDSMTVLCT